MKKLTQLLALLIILNIPSFVNAQDTLGLTCENAPVYTLNEIDGFTSKNVEFSNPSGPSPLCPTGGESHNTSWVAFTTPGGKFKLTIEFSNCSINGTGVQFGIYSDCSFTNSIYCDPSCTGPGSRTIEIELEANKLYYMFIDGCSGDVCDYTLHIGDPISVVHPHVYLDENKNCQFDPGEKTFKSATLVDEFNGQKRLFASGVDHIDNFQNHVGKHKYSLISYNNALVSCPSFIELDIDATNPNPEFYIGLQPLNDCPILKTELSISNIRLCRNSIFTIDYANEGGLDVPDTYIDLFVPTDLVYQSSSVPLAINNPPSYRFNLGTVPSQASGKITVSFGNPCDPSNLGKTICAEAHIHPDTICHTDSLWNGASLALSVKCNANNNKAEFTVTNIGTADMTAPKSFAIIEDEIMPLIIGDVKLNKGQSRIVDLPANGSTYRMYQEQIDHHPGYSKPTVAIEGCGVNANGGVSHGFISKFVENEGDGFIAIECKEIIGSYDPNKKLVSPIGFGVESYIQNDDRLEYSILFQNLGNASAEKVRLVDNLDKNLDPLSFEVISASHAFTYSIVDRSLEVVFDNINLAAKSINEAQSEGYFRFKINALPGLSKGTKLENYAEIFFDHNPPIMTNTVQLSIFEPYITKTIQIIKDVNTKIYPNPSNDIVNIDLKENSYPASLIIFNQEGAQLGRVTLNSKENKISIKNYISVAGTYLFQVIDKFGKQSITKMVITNKN